jgi:hypothetical protein
MSVSGIPDEVARFVTKHIDSVEQLEVLLLLSGSSDRQWSAAGVAQELRIAPESAAYRLTDLAARGLLETDGGTEPLYRYRPRSGVADQAVSGLAQAYRERRVSIINLIFSKPLDKIQTFADAFKLRKDQKP